MNLFGWQMTNALGYSKWFWLIALGVGLGTTPEVQGGAHCKEALRVQSQPVNRAQVLLEKTADSYLPKGNILQSARSSEWSSVRSPIIDELVELNLSGRAQGPGDSLWGQINVQSLIVEKKAEIERTLGKDRAIELFREVQVQVLRRIMAPDQNANRDAGRANSTSSRRQHKVKAFNPTLKREFAEHSGPVNLAAFSSDGRLVLTVSSDQTAKLWDAASGQLLHTFDGQSNWVLSAVFSPDGRQVLSASDDNTAKLWSLYSDFDVDSDRQAELPRVGGKPR
jgi:WD40 repeat protein